MTPEELAQKEIQKLKEAPGFSFPIDPFKVLKDSSVLITLKNFENIDGIIINDENNCTIVGINNNCGFQRQRFTAAHEYCHFIKDLKKEEGSTNSISCFKKSKKEIEKYADEFASYFLMPTDELKNVCNQYKNSKGFVDFSCVTMIAEYFGVSFSACLFRIAYGLNMIEGDTSKESLCLRMKQYGVDDHRKMLIKDTIDNRLLSNIVSSMSYIMTDLNKFTGQKFLQNYIFNDNRLEGVIIEREKLNYVLADLNYNGINSEFFKSDDESIIMTLGNFELQKYVIETEEDISVYKCRNLHCLLYKFVPYPDDNGKYRTNDAILKKGTIQPVPYNEISFLIEELDDELQYFLSRIDDYDIGEYIEQVAYFTYRLIVIHPFSDGNGRISRAFMNWLLIKKGIPPIYIDKDCREEYYKSLSEIDVDSNPNSFIMLIEKRIIHTMMEIHSNLFVDDIE